MALPRGAMGLSAVCDCGISDHTHLLFLNRIVGKPNFSDQFKKIIKRYKKVGYNLVTM